MELKATDYAYAGRWWRFSAYEWRYGLIAPARGARLETYDPWESLRRMRRVS